MIKIVIFDFDGTIADTEHWSLGIYNELAQKYGYKQLTIEELEEIKKHPFSHVLQTLGIPYTKLFTLLKEGQKLLKQHMNDVQAFSDQLKPTLKKIKKSTGVIGIISSNTKKNIRRFLKNKGLEMDFVISSPLFSKEIKINRIIKKYRATPEQALYVGDEVRDIIASKKAQVRVAAVTWGYTDRSLLEAESPDFLIDTMEDLVEIVTKY